MSLPKDKEPTLRIVPMPSDTNYAGSIFGGWIMSHTDIAGSIPAVRYSRGHVVTVAVNQFEFHHPVHVGDVVSFYAEIVRIGRTSITVKVEVYAERNPASVECIKVTEAILTYVAIDERGARRVVGGEKSAEM